MGLDPLGLDLESYSVPDVADELREQAGISNRFAVSQSSGKLRIQSPTPESVGLVSKRAGLMGDKVMLSKADTAVLALAVDLRSEGKAPVVVSDDYAIQNIAEELDIAYQSLATIGIREKYKWSLYCPACFKTYPHADSKVCQVCGTKLKRKPVEKEAVKGNRIKN